MKKKVTLAVLVLLTAMPLYAQLRYVVDAVHGKAAVAYSAKDAQGKSTYKMIIDQKVGEIPNGTEVTVAMHDTVIEWMHNPLIHQKVWSGYIRVDHGGKTVYVDHNDLIWSENNPEGTHNFYKADAKHHTTLGHFYNSMTPYWLAVLLAVLAMVIGFMMSKKGANTLTTLLFPLLMLGIVAIELGGVFALGKDMLWWLDPKVYGWLRSIVGILLFAFTISIQMQSMKLYQNGLTRGQGGLSVRAPIIGAVVGVVLGVAGLAITGYTYSQRESYKWLYIGVAAGLISVLVGIIVCMVKNTKNLGFLRGLAFSLFAIVYGAGLAAAVVMLILGFIKVFLETILTIAGVYAVFNLMSKTIPSYSYSTGDTIVEVYEEFDPLHLSDK